MIVLIPASFQIFLELSHDLCTRPMTFSMRTTLGFIVLMTSEVHVQVSPVEPVPVEMHVPDLAVFSPDRVLQLKPHMRRSTFRLSVGTESPLMVTGVGPFAKLLNSLKRKVGCWWHWIHFNFVGLFSTEKTWSR